MFNLTMRERLKKVILNASENMLYVYEEQIRKLLSENDISYIKENMEEFEDQFIEIRREYINSVADAVFNMCKVIAGSFAAKMELMRLSPDLSGYDIDLAYLEKYGFSAGMVYAMCYKVLTDKEAQAKDMSELNYKQQESMDRVLAKLDTELSGKENAVQNSEEIIHRKSKMIASIFLCLFIISIIGNISQFAFHKYRMDDNNNTIQLLRKTIYNREISLEGYRDKMPELNFFRDHAVIVNPGSSEFHHYGCKKLNLHSFLIFNTENARGYVPCEDCYLVEGNTIWYTVPTKE